MLASDPSASISQFVKWAQGLKGDEKGEAQLFCERLFQAFGHAGVGEAGAELEHRVRGKKGKATGYADLLWPGLLLLEMKKRGEKLERHYSQIFDYWLRLVPQRPRYVVLCNFDEFWIYDFDTQLEEPMDRVVLEDLPERYTALNFLFNDDRRPQFGNDRIAVTRAAADKLAHIFNSTVDRGEDREEAQRFVLQSVVALFSEDAGLLPRGLFTQLVQECAEDQSTYDLLGGLFRQMGEPRRARGWRYQGVPYFNGGIFEAARPIELTPNEVELLAEAASENWRMVQPQVFGTLFQSSMDATERHAYGAHFTTEADIQKIVTPTIVRPWRELIEDADTLEKLRELRRQLLSFRVLDPACGAGDFLYVAYRELRRLDLEILTKIHANFSYRATEMMERSSAVSPKQFFGIEANSFGVELAKITLMLAKELAIQESRELLAEEGIKLPLDLDTALPLDNLDLNIRCEDALFAEWPQADAIIGNPPYQSKNKMQQEFGNTYVNRVRERYPEVPGRADYCVYWFKRAHDELEPDKRAGLVGTNTIRQNYSREGSLDHIVHHGGTITEAVSTQVWSGEAVVYVSIVNWTKGDEPGTKLLFRQLGDRRDSDFEVIELDHIHAALSGKLDVTGAKKLRTNADAPACYQGQTHGHPGFLLATAEDLEGVVRDERARESVHPYLIADDLLGTKPPAPQRYVIDLNRSEDVFTAMKSGKAFERIRDLVLPDVEEKARQERVNTGRETGPRQTHFRKWWRFWRGRLEMLSEIEKSPRYIVCGQVTKRPIFEFVSNQIRPNAALQVFPMPDDYSFGILQSGLHWLWFIERCSTLKGDFRYTSNTVFDSFPWPQSPTWQQINDVAKAAIQLRALRHHVMRENSWNFRELYRTVDLPGDNPLKNAHEVLDNAVRWAYGMQSKEDPLTFLLALNGELADQEAAGQTIVGPGLHPAVEESNSFVSEDCVTMDGLFYEAEQP